MPGQRPGPVISLKGVDTMRLQTHLVVATLLAVGALLGWLMSFGGFIAESPAQNKKAEPTPAAAAPRPADERAIRDAAQSLARAFEKGDATALASFFTEDGEYLDEGQEPVRGRAALAKAYGDFFAKRKELRVDLKTDNVRFLGRDTAVEEGTFTVYTKDSPPNSSRYSALYVRQDGRWLIALLKEWGDDKAKPDQLKHLAFLIGAWKSNGSEGEAKISYEWVENKKFIASKYTITNKKDLSQQSGMQIIGVDPVLGRIRAWTFDSAGGLGESVWTFQDDRWVIDSQGTLPDGSETTAVNFLTPKNDNEFTWRSVRRTHEADKLPDIGPVSVKRVSK
jgi:uncharacterized protein (TIGR02246 family)